MAFTDTQILLIRGLRVFNVEQDGIVAILAILDTDTKMNALMSYMASNRGASPDDIMMKAIEISESINKDDI